MPRQMTVAIDKRKILWMDELLTGAKDNYFDASLHFVIEVSGNIPQNDAAANGDIEGMLGAELLDFYAPVHDLHHFVAHPFHLIAEHQRRLWIEGPWSIPQDHRAPNLFHRVHAESLPLQFLHGIDRGIVVLPIHGVSRSEGRFVDLPVRWYGGNAAEMHFFTSKGVHGAKYGTYVLGTADVVEDDVNGQLFRRAEGFGVQSAQSFIRYFLSHVCVLSSPGKIEIPPVPTRKPGTRSPTSPPCV